MKKIFVCLAVGLVLLTISGVFAETSVDGIEKIKEKMKEKGVEDEEINNITQVDYNDLPPEIEIDDIEETELAIYKVDKKDDKPFFVITPGEKFQESSKEPTYYRTFLNFGYSGTMSGSGFLETATGVETDLEKGYVMMRDGSITAISTNLEVFEEASGSLEITVYVNGERVGFGNLVDMGSSGVKRDYAVQSFDVVNFEAGDIISVALMSSDGSSESASSWGDVTTLVEITTED